MIPRGCWVRLSYTRLTFLGLPWFTSKLRAQQYKVLAVSPGPRYAPTIERTWWFSFCSRVTVYSCHGYGLAELWRQHLAAPLGHSLLIEKKSIMCRKRNNEYYSIVCIRYVAAYGYTHLHALGSRRSTYPNPHVILRAKPTVYDMLCMVFINMWQYLRTLVGIFCERLL